MTTVAKNKKSTFHAGDKMTCRVVTGKCNLVRDSHVNCLDVYICAYTYKMYTEGTLAGSCSSPIMEVGTGCAGYGRSFLVQEKCCSICAGRALQMQYFLKRQTAWEIIHRFIPFPGYRNFYKPSSFRDNRRRGRIRPWREVLEGMIRMEEWQTIEGMHVHAWSISGLETCVVLKKTDLGFVAFDMGASTRESLKCQHVFIRWTILFFTTLLNDSCQISWSQNHLSPLRVILNRRKRFKRNTDQKQTKIQFLWKWTIIAYSSLLQHR